MKAIQRKEPDSRNCLHKLRRISLPPFFNPGSYLIINVKSKIITYLISLSSFTFEVFSFSSNPERLVEFEFNFELELVEGEGGGEGRVESNRGGRERSSYCLEEKEISWIE